MSSFNADDASLAGIILIEELLQALSKSNVLPEARIADVVRDAVARVDTIGELQSGAVLRHYFEHWLTR